jgi:hypothetical protein
VYALIDRNRDHKVDEVKIIATGWADFQSELQVTGG